MVTAHNNSAIATKRLEDMRGEKRNQGSNNDGSTDEDEEIGSEKKESRIARNLQLEQMHI